MPSPGNNATCRCFPRWPCQTLYQRNSDGSLRSFKRHQHRQTQTTRTWTTTMTRLCPRVCLVSVVLFALVFFLINTAWVRRNDIPRHPEVQSLGGKVFATQRDGHYKTTDVATTKDRKSPVDHRKSATEDRNPLNEHPKSPHQIGVESPRKRRLPTKDRKSATEDRKLPHQVGKDPPRKRRLPQCIIIGSMKSGTSALLAYLDLHPDIVTVIPELNYFNRHNDRGLEWYRGQMPLSRQNQITIEKTPEYFEHAETPARMRAMNASIKILLIVRDPVYRSVSHWLHKCASRHVMPIGMCDTYEGSGILTPEGDVKPTSGFIVRSSFGRFVDHWTSWLIVGKQLHIVDGDKMVSDPVSELRKVESFLGLRHHITQKHFVFSKKRGFYCMVYDRGQTHCMGYNKGVKHPTLDREVEAKLRDYFRPLNQRFYRAIGYNFGWR